MSVIELKQTYDITGPHGIPQDSLCSSCKVKGKSFLCLVNKKSQYPDVRQCDDYTPQQN